MKAKILLFVMIQLSAIVIHAQNLDEALGGVKTNFELISGTIDLKPADQIIILRAERKSYSDASFGTGWGYGYQSLHLEFSITEKLTEEKFRFKTGRDNEDKIALTFYDSDNVILTNCQLNYSDVDLLYNLESVRSQFFYSIDLINIPIVLLNKTAKINLIKKVADRN